MKEREYINASNRVRVSLLCHIARELIPENCTAINKEEHRTVCEILANWETKLFESINVEET